jgi:hypothetical protein
MSPVLGSFKPFLVVAGFLVVVDLTGFGISVLSVFADSFLGTGSMGDCSTETAGFSGSAAGVIDLTIAFLLLLTT